MRKIPHCCLPQESGPCLSPSVADRPLRPATRQCLGEPLPHQQADRPRDPPEAPEHFLCRSCDRRRVSGISHSFPWLSQSSGQVSHVLRTRSPLGHCPKATSFDLHVLGTPPAFVLSQDQTLRQHLQQLPPREATAFDQMPASLHCLGKTGRFRKAMSHSILANWCLDESRSPPWLDFLGIVSGRRHRREVRRAIARTGFSVLSSVFKERGAVTLAGEPHCPGEPGTLLCLQSGPEGHPFKRRVATLPARIGQRQPKMSIQNNFLPK